MSHSLELLISKLNDTARRAAEQAVAQCQQRGHHEVDLEHLFLALLRQPVNDVTLLCRHAEVPIDGLCEDLEAELRRETRRSPRPPVFSVHVPLLLEQAWLLASLASPPGRIRSAHLLLAWLTEPTLAQLAAQTSARLRGLPLDEFKHRWEALTQASPEAVVPVVMATAGAARGDGGGLGGGLGDGRGDGRGDGGRSGWSGRQGAPTPALDQFTLNLTERARSGALDPVIGRDAEIRQTMDILLRRRQNNPLLVGEPGVGKTAVVEGLALRMAGGDVPPALQGVAIHALDIGLLQAGASVKGEFEARLQGVMAEVLRSPHPIVLFIDEAHTLLGAGGAAGGHDAANLLKPALARGELRTIAATTWSEYKLHIDKDGALARRFQTIRVDEPSEPVAVAMLRAMAPVMAQHFGVSLLDEAITEAVRLSARYIAERQLPDKAVSLLDTACARVALGQGSTPARIEDGHRWLAQIDAESRALQAELDAGLPAADPARHVASHGARLDALGMQRLDVQARLSRDEDRWLREQQLVEDILRLRRQIRGAEGQGDGARGGDEVRDAGCTGPAAWRAELQRLQQVLAAQQQRVPGEGPLVPLQVDAQVVADIVSSWTGVPLGRMLQDEVQAVRELPATLAARVIGQGHALDAVVQRVRTAFAGLEDPSRPRGVFLFVGPSGVGKTETALALADSLYGGERNLITINMSEYQEAHSVSGLKGSPPGYVGHGQGGVLTEAVRRKPYSVLLLDEVEKAHPDVLELFFQVFDKGRMDDAEGREIDFRHTLIILTSNVGSQQIMRSCLVQDDEAGGPVMLPPHAMPDAEALAEALRPVLYQAFKPAFVGRTKVVPYHPLHDDVLAEVIRLKLARIAERVRDRHQASFSYDEALIDSVLARCTEVDTGARAVDHILHGQLLPQMADQVLSAMAQGMALRRVHVGVTPQGDFALDVA
ncbi:MAG: type VI secretion system ATPase TssH [Proteobacteria bacterium]|uniref:type VI secretion system ATPase TssH n=1 Tax=Aquabacterium sp. TaxID=1872578 RepID=UPI0035C6C6B4|nr:type VI secretion system ATPase TssH [Pseudomonadota bacterium]